MKLYYWKDKFNNFGDELNPWLWEKLIPGFFDNDGRYLFAGIGTLLNELMPKALKTYVFGSGVGYGKQLPEVDASWEFYCVRGPLSAKKLNLDAKLAITDPAILLRKVWKKDVSKKYKFSYMPHAVHANSGWQRICDDHGIGYVDARLPIDIVLETISESECLLTEAMHGAIAADALRVPWVPVHTSSIILPFKWVDWCESVHVNYLPQMIEENLLPVWAFKKAPNVRAGIRQQVKSYLIARSLKRIYRNSGKQLSNEKTFRNRLERLEEKIEEFKDDIRSGMFLLDEPVLL